ncbi:hypothetical protein WKH81_09355 [Acinetobacter baumannii]
MTAAVIQFEQSEAEAYWDTDFFKGLDVANPIVFDTSTTNGIINQVIYDLIMNNTDEYDFALVEDIERAAEDIIYWLVLNDIHVSADQVIALLTEQLNN